VGTQTSGLHQAANGSGGDHGVQPQPQALLPVGSSGLGDGLNGMDFHMESLPSLGSFPR